jgi:hypothetical protein
MQESFIMFRYFLVLYTVSMNAYFLYFLALPLYNVMSAATSMSFREANISCVQGGSSGLEG